MCQEMTGFRHLFKREVQALLISIKNYMNYYLNKRRKIIDCQLGSKVKGINTLAIIDGYFYGKTKKDDTRDDESKKR